jgi:hypothetical protein
MNRNVFWAVFGCVAALVYVPAYQFVWAPVIYYPAIGQLSFTHFFSDFVYSAPKLPPEAKAGPGMTWYGWMISGMLAGLVAGLVASVIPGPAVERLVYRFGWILPAIAIIACFALDAHFYIQ